MEIVRTARTLAALVHSVTLTSPNWPDQSALSLRRSSKLLIATLLKTYDSPRAQHDVRSSLGESTSLVEGMMREIDALNVLPRLSESERSALADSCRSTLSSLRSLLDPDTKQRSAEFGDHLSKESEENPSGEAYAGLDDRVVVVTRPMSQSDPIVDMIRHFGGLPVVIPMIEISDTDNWKPADQSIVDLGSYDGIIFTSQNAVERMVARIDKIDPAAKQILAARRVYAVGEKTRLSLENAQIPVTLVPERYSAKDLVASLLQVPLAGKRLLFAKGNLAKEDLPRSLRAAGIIVDEVEVYKTTGPEGKSFDPLRQALGRDEIDAVVFFSPSGVQNFSQYIGPLSAGKCLIACIGPSTQRAAELAGFPSIVTAREATAESLVQSLVLRFSDDAHNHSMEI